MEPISTDIVIIGAGPGGLAAAHAITAAAPQVQVSVFERSAASLSGTRRGAGLGLDVNGQKALQAINPDLLAQVLQMASILRNNRVLRPDGSLVAEVPMGQGLRKEFAEQGYKTPCLLGWSELQQLLAESLPGNVTLHTGLEFERYEQPPGGDGITAYFLPTGSIDAGCEQTATPAAQAAGTTAAAGVSAQDTYQQQQQQQQQQQEGALVKAVKAQLLVAADGYFSRVRRQCLVDGPPEWGETLVYRARLPAAAAAAAGVELCEDSIFLQDVGRFLFAYPISSGDVVWTVGVGDDKLKELGLDSADIRQQLHNSSSSKTAGPSSSSSSSSNGDVASGSSSSSAAAAETRSNGVSDYTQLQTQGYCPQETAAGHNAQARCLQVLAGLWGPVLQLVRTTPPSSLVEHGVYTRPTNSINPDCFGKGRVVIIGDAAHPLRPTGQGLNQTLEDAWGLGKALKDSTLGSAAQLDALQAFREQRAERVAPIVAFTSASGKAAYTTKKDASDEQTAAMAAMGADTKEMTAEQFSEYCCGVEFARLSVTV